VALPNTLRVLAPKRPDHFILYVDTQYVSRLKAIGVLPACCLGLAKIAGFATSGNPNHTPVLSGRAILAFAGSLKMKPNKRCGARRVTRRIECLDCGPRRGNRLARLSRPTTPADNGIRGRLAVNCGFCPAWRRSHHRLRRLPTALSERQRREGGGMAYKLKNSVIPKTLSHSAALTDNRSSEQA
jgi:hypothetical protein